MANLAFLGTGLLGTGFVRSLLKQGHRVTVWNRSIEKARALEAAGAHVASTPADAARDAERVHLCLADDAAVDAVLAAALPVEDSPTTALVLDHSTVSPAGAARRAEELSRRGIAFLHAPVFMSPANAERAQGLMMVCGPEALFRRAEPSLRTMSAEVWHVGERLGLAAAYKLFGNAMIVGITATLSDIFTMARALDIPAPDARGVFAHFAAHKTIDYRGSKMAVGDYSATFELPMARKDVSLMIAAAEGGGPLAVLPSVMARIDELLARGHALDDLGVLSVDAVPSRTSGTSGTSGK